jgi:N-glycosylase/DNA lyase
LKIELQKLYKKILPIAAKRIIEFKEIWEKANDRELFTELAFCLLTPQSKARNAWEAIKSLVKSRALFTGTNEAIAKELNVVRFKNKKAEYIVLAREKFISKGLFHTRKILNDAGNIYERRKWLVRNIKGLGYKEASHFIRNIGFVEDVAILDRHILKNLKLLNVIDKIPEGISFSGYLMIEQKMKRFATEIDIPLEYLDFVLWYKETGEVFK